MGGLYCARVLSRIVVSGARSALRPERDYDRLFADFLGPFTLPDRTVYVGGALGIDTLALRWLARETKALVTVVVPATLEEQPREAAGAIRVAAASGRVHELIELVHPDFPSTEAYHARNRWMVDRSELLVAFPLNDGESRGTAYTIDYAASRGVPRLVVGI